MPFDGRTDQPAEQRVGVGRTRTQLRVSLGRDVHPYYIATQAHPELRSRPTAPHPLFRGLVGAAIERNRASELFDVSADD